MRRICAKFAVPRPTIRWRLRMHFFQTSGFRKPTNSGRNRREWPSWITEHWGFMLFAPRITNIIHIPPKNAGFCCLFSFVKCVPFFEVFRIFFIFGEVRWSPQWSTEGLHDEFPQGRPKHPADRQATTQAWAAVPGANGPPHDPILPKNTTKKFVEPWAIFCLYYIWSVKAISYILDCRY